MIDESVSAAAGPTLVLTTEYLPHQQRVVTEKAELDEKLTKLRVFFDTPVYKSLDIAEQGRLQAQSLIMGSYSSILANRIAAF